MMNHTENLLSHLDVLSQKSRKENLAFFKSISKKKMRMVDDKVHQLHHEVFEEIDCLSCANCCKTLGPRILDKDIQRASKHLKMKEVKFIEEYLKIDEDGDYVFKTMPCPFLLPDHYCMIYEARPKACREYPHTDRPKFLQIAKLSVKNTETCPAVYQVLERLRKEF